MKVIDYSSVQDQVMDIMSQYHLDDWKFNIDSSKTRGGYCNPSKTIISLSQHFIDNAGPAEIENTILHEVAHAIAFVLEPKANHGHDHYWYTLARAIGCDGKRCHDVEMVKEYRYQTNCTGCGKVSGFHRKTRHHIRICSKCGTRIIFNWERDDSESK